jgi:hypothetical protein
MPSERERHLIFITPDKAGNGTTALGAPVTVVNDAGSLSVTSLPVGLNSLTAVYSGDLYI